MGADLPSNDLKIGRYHIHKHIAAASHSFERKSPKQCNQDLLQHYVLNIPDVNKEETDSDFTPGGGI